MNSRDVDLDTTRTLRIAFSWQVIAMYTGLQGCRMCSLLYATMHYQDTRAARAAASRSGRSPVAVRGSARPGRPGALAEGCCTLISSVPERGVSTVSGRSLVVRIRDCGSRDPGSTPGDRNFVAHQRPQPCAIGLS
jgi:hypothetical protein